MKLTQSPRGWIFVGLLGWQGVLLLASNWHASLMAHDEGWYATLAMGLVRLGDWLTPRWWGQLMYDKTSGIHWLIATAYSLFGISEVTARIPSMVACLLSVCLTYAIGYRLLHRQAAWLSALCLSTFILWNQYGHMATQDMPLVAIELIMIWALLQAERKGPQRWVWGLLAGLGLGLGFLVKGFMVALAAIALLPYLILNHRQHRHWHNPGLYLGLGLGIGLVLLWFGQLWTTHGVVPFQQIFGTLGIAAAGDYHGVGPWYYGWNIPANLLPWTPLVLWGIIKLCRQPLIGHKWLLLGYPALLLLQLQLFPTKTLYYTLQLYPFFALYGGYILAELMRGWTRPGASRLPLALTSYGYGLSGSVVSVIGLGILLRQWGPLNFLAAELGPELTWYGGLALVVGLSWVTLLLAWHHQSRQSRIRPVRAWLLSLFLGPWLAIGLAGIGGLLGNYSADMKAFCQQPAVAEVLANHTVDVVLAPQAGINHKTWVLASFYTSHWGERLTSVAAIPAGHSAWVSEAAVPTIPDTLRRLGTVRGWALVSPVP
ncbi:Undecaprenyl phosphate-alpha-4-amino-4-deoxy-L-arabinose arabinosyl transferase 2 [Halomicronema hongdechloris C2206]|uniref:Undecaprenyl phosphate-alpha-4-amino-4-deoxy-L-arabinose arabinosyl transferase 2 n=1 Tax=Halomicronema hongdechloris C2206 TaxID=1641165 RepID=A0A1Z3HSN4_9CYAN|nr:glycosyltransferase family 39 protein [Halomicronema hongdechloris]ASC73137.1 Undecaprenyl phosphate-alpha-4-amino-4-deoxy-L-arabinose arabinosyl transferase 2 [Halomicronema hongdechloris C2206]